MAAWDLHVEQLRVSWADFWEEISTGSSLLIHSYNKQVFCHRSIDQSIYVPETITTCSPLHNTIINTIDIKAVSLIADIRLPGAQTKRTVQLSQRNVGIKTQNRLSSLASLVARRSYRGRTPPFRSSDSPSTPHILCFFQGVMEYESQCRTLCFSLSVPLSCATSSGPSALRRSR